MFKALLKVQWKSSRGLALLGAILGFATPLASIQGWRGDGTRAAAVVGHMQDFGVWYAVLAAGVGLAFALNAWSADHKGRHVYALSLPVDRSRYAAMRFGAGSLFLLIPAVSVLAGCLVAAGIAPIPTGLHAYPVSLALRFALASAVAFSLFFAVATATPRAAGIVLGLIASVFLLAFVMNAASVEFDLLGRTGDLLFSESGLLAIFTGRWMLIDA